MTIKENLAYMSYFGFPLTFYKTINKLVQSQEQRCGKQSDSGFFPWIHKRNNEEIECYLRRVCCESYSKLRDGFYDEISIPETSGVTSVQKNNAIWTMWWQGEEHAPPLVRACIDSMRRHSAGHPVIVLDQENYREYVPLPGIITARISESTQDTSALRSITLGFTHRSDIIRCALLSRHGGLWTDATMMFSGNVDEKFFTEPWNTLGQDNRYYIGQGEWSTFFMSCCAGNGLLRFIYDAHLEYWQKKQYYVHYLMMDHMFDIACKTRSVFRKMMDSVQCGNRKCLTVNRHYADVCSEAEAVDFFRQQYFHKLSWKWWGAETDAPLYLKTERGEDTWLGYLFKIAQISQKLETGGVKYLLFLKCDGYSFYNFYFLMAPCL